MPAVLLLTMPVAGCTDGCDNIVIHESASPSGQVKAVMFQRDCGATTGFSTQISVIPTNDELTGGGNAFIADDDHGAAYTGDWGGPWAEMQWVAPDRLIIRYADKARIFEQNGKVSGVRIIYQPVRHHERRD
ncbi:MAG: hypothetical protein JNM03_14270 [Sphingopyxis sp.]|uniref:hypothetical protein n=1 Tax=Sphingopyxis sp. TaxID=1908224 RepID=UPI001A50431B|nr:hypothetical protein [Sphingopyxis sp.]MBL9071143.1 hypothetical protein [Sphingopyxis sp.]